MHTRHRHYPCKLEPHTIHNHQGASNSQGFGTDEVCPSYGSKFERGSERADSVWMKWGQVTGLQIVGYTRFENWDKACLGRETLVCPQLVNERRCMLWSIGKELVYRAYPYHQRRSIVSWIPEWAPWIVRGTGGRPNCCISYLSLEYHISNVNKSFVSSLLARLTRLNRAESMMERLFFANEDEAILSQLKGQLSRGGIP